MLLGQLQGLSDFLFSPESLAALLSPSQHYSNPLLAWQHPFSRLDTGGLRSPWGPRVLAEVLQVAGCACACEGAVCRRDQQWWVVGRGTSCCYVLGPMLCKVLCLPPPPCQRVAVPAVRALSWGTACVREQQNTTGAELPCRLGGTEACDHAVCFRNFTSGKLCFPC